MTVPRGRGYYRDELADDERSIIAFLSIDETALELELRCDVCDASSDDVVLEITLDGILYCENVELCSLRFMEQMLS